MKSFKHYISEEHPTWHVTFKTGHKPQKVKGRNTAEAIKKAEKRAQRSGEKDPRQLAMYKGIKKVSEEVEQVDENLNFMIPKGKAASDYMSRKAKMRQDQHREQDPKHAKTHARNMVDMDKAAAKAKKKGVAMRDYGKDNWKVRNGVRRGKLPEGVELTEADIAEILRQYALSENINADQLAALSEEEINEIIGKAIGGAFKLGAKAAVGAGRLAGKAAKRAVMTKQGNIRGTKAAKMDREGDKAEKQAKKAEKERAQRDRIKAARERVNKARNDLNKAQAKPATS